MSMLPARRIELPGITDLRTLKPDLNPANLLYPLREILRNPVNCWETFRTDGMTFQSLFERYVFILAAVPAIAGFIGHGILGETGIAKALTLSLSCYLLSIAFMYGAAYLAHRTAEMFDGAVSLDQSAKLVVYSLMPFYFAGAFLLLPQLSALSLIGTAAVYLFITGTKKMTNIAAPKRLTFSLINVVSWLVVADAILTNIF